jgi:hypothetical protein
VLLAILKSFDHNLFLPGFTSALSRPIFKLACRRSEKIWQLYHSAEEIQLLRLAILFVIMLLVLLLKDLRISL